jgi:biopolymer transport protein ExbB/TolQ
VLAGYFLAINWIFLYRFLFLNDWAKKEQASLEALLLGSESVTALSHLNQIINNRPISKPLLTLAEISTTRDVTKFLSFLAMVASTAPFIGLFGTVVSLLGTFTAMAANSTGTIGIVTAGVSDALVATAVGIFVAIFAYSYHQILKRKAYEVVELIRMQGETLLSKVTL